MMLQHHSSHSSGRSSLAAGLRMLDVNGCDGSVLHGSKWCRFTSHIFMLSPQQPCQFLPMTEKSFLNRVERFFYQHGSLNVPIEHHPTIRYMVYNGYYKVMSNIPKMGQLPTPEQKRPVFSPELRAFCPISQLVSPQNHGHGSPPTWRNLEHPRYVVPPKPEMFIG